MALIADTLRPRHPRRSAFSLVEVVLALGVFAVAIVGVIGLLAPSLQTVSEVEDVDVAARLATEIQAELTRAGFTQVDGALPRADLERRLYLVATRSGDRMMLTGRNRADPDAATAPLPSPANVAPDDPTAPGVAYRDRYFLVEVKLEPTLGSLPALPASYLPLHIKVIWPWRVPTGPVQNASLVDDGTSQRLDDPAQLEDDLERRSYTDFNLALPR